MAEQERAVQVKGDEPLPVVERQLIHRRAGMRDDRAAADRVDQDVDGAELLRHGGDKRVDLGRVKRVDASPVRPPASRAQRRDRRVEPALVDVDGDHDRALSRP